MKGEKGLNLGDETRACIEKHFEEGIPLEDLKGMRPQTIERFKICMELFELVQQDPTFNERAWLRHIKKRTSPQIYRDEQMFDIILQYLNPQRKARAAFIVERTAERIIRQGEQTGDWKPQHAGAKLIAEVNRLGEAEEAACGVGDTYNFAPVLVNIHDMDETRQNLDDETRKKIFAKYKPAVDNIAQQLDEKVKLRRSGYDIEDADIIDEE